MLVALTTDPALLARLTALAGELGLVCRPAAGVPDRPPPWRAVVVDLDAPGGAEAVRAVREVDPLVPLAAFLLQPDKAAWLAAQRAGADLVANRGSAIPRLRQLLAAAPEERRYPILDAADVAGRLGLVRGDISTPVGPVALYQVNGRLCAVADRCPHAGAVLSGGELTAAVLTCPGHGSQFDVTTGQRVRGPADDHLATHRVMTEGGQVWLVLPAAR